MLHVLFWHVLVEQQQQWPIGCYGNWYSCWTVR